MNDVKGHRPRFGLLKITLRLSIGVSLLLFLISTVGVHEPLQRLSSVRLWPLLLSLLIGIAGVFLSAYKWQVLLLQASKVHVNLAKLTSLYFIGSFFNNCLPTTVGGDIVRVAKLSRLTGGLANSMTSVLVERITGFLALAGIAALAGVLTLGKASNTVKYIAPLTFMIMTCGTAIFIALPGFGFLEGAIEKIRHESLAQKISTFYQSLVCYAQARRTLAYVILISFIFQASAVYGNYLIADAMNLKVSLIEVAMVAQMATIISMVPVSISGLGVKEAAFVLFFAHVGVGIGPALAFALINRIVYMLVSLPGAFLFLIDKGGE